MATGTIQSGICGFTISVKATCEDSQNVSLEIKSDCLALPQTAIISITKE